LRKQWKMEKDKKDKEVEKYNYFISGREINEKKKTPNENFVLD